jgi:hypothetical protein
MVPDHRAVDLWTIGRTPIAHRVHHRDGDGYRYELLFQLRIARQNATPFSVTERWGKHMATSGIETDEFRFALFGTRRLP